MKRISVANLPPPEIEPSAYTASDEDLPQIFFQEPGADQWEDFLNSTGLNRALHIGSITRPKVPSS
jgi:hypothetical protein